MHMEAHGSRTYDVLFPPQRRGFPKGSGYETIRVDLDQERAAHRSTGSRDVPPGASNHRGIKGGNSMKKHDRDWIQTVL